MNLVDKVEELLKTTDLVVADKLIANETGDELILEEIKFLVGPNVLELNDRIINAHIEKLNESIKSFKIEEYERKATKFSLSEKEGGGYSSFQFGSVRFYERIGHIEKIVHLLPEFEAVYSFPKKKFDLLRTVVVNVFPSSKLAKFVSDEYLYSGVSLDENGLWSRPTNDLLLNGGSEFFKDLNPQDNVNNPPSSYRSLVRTRE